MGGVIASKATSDKNHLSTGTLSFSDLKNEAEYRAKDTGASAQIKPTLVQTKKEDPEGNKIESLKVVQALHATPSIPTVVQGSADSTTKAAVAPGIIDIRENKAQDISALSRDTANALNELGRIFDKKSVEEQKELVNVFREEAFRLAHNLPDDGSGRKTLIHAAIGGLISQLSGAGFASGAAGAGLNEALINNLKGLDPAIAQVISGVIGAAAAKAIHGDATAGVISAASGTKYNFLAPIATEAVELLLPVIAAFGYGLTTDENGQKSVTKLVDGIIETMATYIPDKGWFSSTHEFISDQINDVVIFLKSNGQLKRLPDQKVQELGGEKWTQEIKAKTGKSKADLYWNPKTREVFSIPKQGGEPELVDVLDPD